MKYGLHPTHSGPSNTKEKEKDSMVHKAFCINARSGKSYTPRSVMWTTHLNASFSSCFHGDNFTVAMPPFIKEKGKRKENGGP